MKFLNELLHNTDTTPTINEDVDIMDITLAADKLMALATDVAIEELTEEYGENYLDYISNADAVADKAMKVIQYYVTLGDLIKIQNSRQK